MELKVRIPTSFSQVTLREYIDYKCAKDDIDRVMAVTQLTHKQVRSLKLQSIQFIVKQMDEVLSVEVASRILEGGRTVKINGTWYGLIPDLEAMQFDEFIDASALSSAAYNPESPDLSHLVDLFCVLYRPVTNRIGRHYSIAKYSSDKIADYRKDIEDLPMDVVAGTMLFFSTICNELVTASQQFLEEMMNQTIREVTIPSDQTTPSQEATDGITSSKQSRSATSRNLMRFFKKRRLKSSLISLT